MEPTGEIKIDIGRPLVLTDRQKWLCSHLDALNKVQQFCPNAKPSDLFTGALHVLKADQSSANPDRIAQSAHSLREIMYGIGLSRRPRNKWVVILLELFKRDPSLLSTPNYYPPELE